jgi:hypothetical protein
LVFLLKFDAVTASSERTHRHGTLRGCLVKGFAFVFVPY